jgi:hypothetical protein
MAKTVTRRVESTCAVVNMHAVDTFYADLEKQCHSQDSADLTCASSWPTLSTPRPSRRTHPSLVRPAREDQTRTRERVVACAGNP